MSVNRRQLLGAGAAAAGSLALGGCDRLSENQAFMDVLASAEDLTRHAQRLLIGQGLAPEFDEAEISREFRANGSTDPQDDDYLALVKNKFATWRLSVGGLVERPAKLSLAQLQAFPARTQITRHDCVEGWSCIGKWKGVPLGAVLAQAGVKPEARYVVFRCADSMGNDSLETAEEGGVKYYESIALVDAMHPQTILAYEMNDKPLQVPYGAPLRVRIERQLGYKMAKYIMGIELVDSYANIGGGKGGYWEDRGYEWYAGI